MELVFEGKKTKEEVLSYTPKNCISELNTNNNLLIYGENLTVLATLFHHSNLKEKIDLIYIDPPFATGGEFKVGENGRTSTISKSQKDKTAYKDDLKGEAFLEFLRERLVFARQLLSSKGSIYLHIDYKIGHYVKIIMDEIFGQNNFRGDIARIKCNPKNFSRHAYGNIKDLILFYTKTNDYIWNEPIVPFGESDKKRLYHKIDKEGRAYTTVPLHAPGETKQGDTNGLFCGLLPPKGRHWRTSPKELEKLNKEGLIEWSKNGVPRKKIYANDAQGKKMQDIWDFKDSPFPSYPTQKNLDMLKLIVNTSSCPKSTVLDFFAGSGSTLLAAKALGRKWIGIDSSPFAIEVAKTALNASRSDLFTSKDFDFVDLVENKNQMQQKDKEVFIA